ncbi:Protein of unknown function DUF88 [Trichormus variabilis ATCC 29413]|uniref:NYN domain-containing protein n=2 Tax=Anabaena variabilis TaxID=264691 RepID=Q3M8J5_TRIV2|nr:MULTISPECIES: NYN domain-containing protein [Nostocaceae]ABA22691.1 Protein of unknown function DUF88 [Trichormus variabilis ATCC 29413]MBC1216898.1 NYN domain-containing protein [Trichormus variabilis ARAD]MBC1255756.1 NYN domain-containing protein [Trichormus variabilis V5]MBC1269170.1 NYN domain-containing protein [Trichormus variabilis FSR]MBC1304971.1 NYN domain-containing protein [Trichormus variabilis N2B]
MSDILSISNKQKTKSKNIVALACDYQNVPLTPDTAKLLLEFATSKGRLIHKNVYYNSKFKNQADAKRNLANLSFNWIDVPCLLKNSADNQLIVDCLQVNNNLSPDIFIIVSGDGDFTTLINPLQKLGKQVIVIAEAGNVKQKLKELADEFYFIEELSQKIQQETQHQNTPVKSPIAYNEAIKHLIEAIRLASVQGTATTFSSIDKLMRQRCHQYQGFSSICKNDGKKFKNFSQFVDTTVKDGKVQKRNEKLFLIELDRIPA